MKKLIIIVVSFILSSTVQSIADAANTCRIISDSVVRMVDHHQNGIPLEEIQEALISSIHPSMTEEQKKIVILMQAMAQFIYLKYDFNDSSIGNTIDEHKDFLRKRTIMICTPVFK